MRPVVKKLIALQAGFLLAIGGFIWLQSRETPEDSLERRAEELAGYLRRQEYGKAIDELTEPSEMKDLGKTLVHVRHQLSREFEGKDEEAAKQGLRGRDLVSDLKLRAQMQHLEREVPENARMLQVLLQLDEPEVGPDDLDDPRGETLAAQLAKAFFVRWLEETSLAIDRDRLAVSPPRDVRPEVVDEEEGVRSDYLGAIVRYGDGKDHVDYRFHQRRPAPNQGSVWYLDVRDWLP